MEKEGFCLTVEGEHRRAMKKECEAAGCGTSVAESHGVRFLPFCSVWNLSPRDGAAHIQVDLEGGSVALLRSISKSLL